MKEAQNMLRIIDSKIVEKPSLIKARYPKCKFILTGDYDVNDPKGCLYAVSSDRSSMHELCSLADELSKQGVFVSLMGSYHV